LEHFAGTSSAANDAVLTNLGKGFSVQTKANSWRALVQKVNPTFAWNGRDLLWIQNNSGGELQFVLDEAYIYQPTNQSCYWVLIKERSEKNSRSLRSEDGWRQFGAQYLRAAFPLQPSKPAPNDWDVSGNYAVVKSANRQHGAVYELGWQSEMLDGVLHPVYGRRIYLFRDLGNHWHFVGEGPEERAEHGGGSTVDATIEWSDSKSNAFPFQIKFHQVTWASSGSFSADDADPPSDDVKTNDYIMAGKFPAAPL